MWSSISERSVARLELGIGPDVGAYRDADFIALTTQDHGWQARIDAEATAEAYWVKGKAFTVYKAHAADIAGTQCGVPVGLDFTGFFVNGNAVIDAVVDDYEGRAAKAK